MDGDGENESRLTGEDVGMKLEEQKAGYVAKSGAIALACAALGFLVGCKGHEKGAAKTEADREEKTAQRGEDPSESGERETDVNRVIVLVADGMGASAVEGAQRMVDGGLATTSMPNLGFLTTHSHEYVTTDSAASATAMATGSKTHYEGVGVAPGTDDAGEDDEANHLESVVERAEAAGWRTGLVSTVRIVHATPAAFGAHRDHRHDYEGIAADMVDNEIDVLLGGGREYFVERSDGQNLWKQLGASGATRATTAQEFRRARREAERLVGLFELGDLPSIQDGGRPVSLAEMTRGAIDVLDRNNDEGFFLMVEGARVDWEGHDLDGEGVIREMLDFDRAVGAAREYAADRDDTLVVAVSDHETGGLTVLDGDAAGRLAEELGGRSAIRQSLAHPSGGETGPPPMPELETANGGTMVPTFGHLSLASRAYAEEPSEFWSIHTPEMVPVWAEGAGAEWVAGARDNAELGRRVKALVDDTAEPGGESEERVARTEDESKPPKNVVLLVGDGMGMDAVTSGVYTGGIRSMRGLPVRGLVDPRPAGGLRPTEGSAATALATGERTRSRAVGRVPGNDGELRAATSVLERAESAGFETGLVTDGSISNPTTAAWYASGSIEDGSAATTEDLAEMPRALDGSDGVDVVFAAGEDEVGETGRGALADAGYRVERGFDEETDPPDDEEALVRLSEDGPPLEALTNRALERLSGEGPFFLVVESDRIGALQERLERGAALPRAVRQFDGAVGAAADFASKDGETLVVATADRDLTTSVFDNHYGFSVDVCGAAARQGGPVELEGIDVAADDVVPPAGLDAPALQGDYSPPEVFVQYAWAVDALARREDQRRPVASSDPVPLFAGGPWSSRLEGHYDQPRVGQVLGDWVEAVDQGDSR